jgi:hypothetical protein
MRVKYLRIATFLAAALFAVGLTAQDDVYNKDLGIGGDPGATSCKMCIAYGGGSFAGMACVTPVGGGWGTDACWVESYPEQTYCFSVGHDCCVD